LQIVQGGENYTNDALISIAGTGEHLAWVKDTQFNTIDSSRFISITPGGPLPEAFNTPSPVDPLTGEPVGDSQDDELIDNSSTAGLSNTTATVMSQPNSSTPAPIDQSNSTITAPISQQISATTAPATIGFQAPTATTIPHSLTVTSATTTTDDILLKGGAIPTLNSFSGIDDDILIYDSHSLLTSLTSAQTQPTLPLQAASLSGNIAPVANFSGKEANLLVSANPSPSQLLTISGSSGTSIL
jgi:hypothetical protein